jgi:hypothetical protein
MLRLFGLTASLLAGLTGCQQPIAGLAETHYRRRHHGTPRICPSAIGWNTWQT